MVSEKLDAFKAKMKKKQSDLRVKVSKLNVFVFLLKHQQVQLVHRSEAIDTDLANIYQEEQFAYRCHKKAFNLSIFLV